MPEGVALNSDNRCGMNTLNDIEGFAGRADAARDILMCRGTVGVESHNATNASFGCNHASHSGTID